MSPTETLPVAGQLAFQAPVAFLRPSSVLTSSISSRPSLRVAAPRRATRQRVRMAADGASPSGGGDSEESPGGRVISTALEVGFRTVWIQLLTAGVGEGYEAAITAFVVACIAARKAGYGMTALKFELQANELVSDDPELQKATLNDREKSTRLIWVALVWMTLRRYRFEAGNTPTDDEIAAGVGSPDESDEALARGLKTLVESVCDAADRGYTLSTYKLEMNVNRGPNDEPPSASMLSIQSQWARIVFATVQLLPDSLLDARKQK